MQVASVTPGQYIALKRGDILTSGKLSAATTETLRVAGLDEGVCAKTGLPCIEAMEASIVVREEDKRSSLAELWLQYAMTLPAPKREYSASGRAKTAINELDADFQPRRTHGCRSRARPTPTCSSPSAPPTSAASKTARPRSATITTWPCRRRRCSCTTPTPPGACTTMPTISSWAAGRSCWLLREASALDERTPTELVPAASLSFTGTLRSVHRRDGFGAELVAVMDDPAATTPSTTPAAVQASPSATQSWSEMPSPSMTVLLRFSGKNLWEVLHDDEPELEIHDPTRFRK